MQYLENCQYWNMSLAFSTCHMFPPSVHPKIVKNVLCSFCEPLVYTCISRLNQKLPSFTPALPTRLPPTSAQSIRQVGERLADAGLRQQALEGLRVGVHWNTEVSGGTANHRVCQVCTRLRASMCIVCSVCCVCLCVVVVVVVVCECY